MRQTRKRIGAMLLVLMLLIAAQGTAALAKTHTLGNLQYGTHSGKHTDRQIQGIKQTHRRGNLRRPRKRNSV